MRVLSSGGAGRASQSLAGRWRAFHPERRRHLDRRSTGKNTPSSPSEASCCLSALLCLISRGAPRTLDRSALNPSGGLTTDNAARPQASFVHAPRVVLPQQRRDVGLRPAREAHALGAGGHGRRLSAHLPPACSLWSELVFPITRPPVRDWHSFGAGCCQITWQACFSCTTVNIAGVKHPQFNKKKTYPPNCLRHLDGCLGYRRVKPSRLGDREG